MLYLKNGGTKGGEGSSGRVLPKPQTPLQTQVSAPSPFSLAETTHRWLQPGARSTSRERQEMKEFMEHGGTGQEVYTHSRGEPNLQAEATSAPPAGPPNPLHHRQTQPPSGPADPAGPKLSGSFSFVKRTQIHFFHAPLGSVLLFPEGRVGGGCRLRSWLGPSGPGGQSSDPTLLPGHPLPPIPRGLAPKGQPCPLHSQGRCPPPLAPRPPPTQGSLAAPGWGPQRRGLEEFGSSPTTRSPRLAPAAAAAPLCPTPSATGSRPGSAQAPGSCPSHVGSDREKRRGGKEGTFYSLPPSLPACNPFKLKVCESRRAQ